MKIFRENSEIQYIMPLAVLYGSIDGCRFIAEVKNKSGKRVLSFFTPPHYDLASSYEIESYILDSAIVKHGFVVIQHSPISTTKDYERFLHEINQSNAT